MALTAGGAPDLPTIQGIALEPIECGAGLMGTLMRCRLAYHDNADAGPKSVVIKLPSTDPKSSRMNRWQSLYRREYGFYSRLANDAPIRTAAMLYGDFQERSQRFVLVLEDLGDMVTADQIHGIAAPQARSAVRAVARLHGHYWNKMERLRRSGCYDSTSTKLRPLMQLAYLAYLPPTLADFGHLFSDRMRRLAETLGPRVADYVGDVAVGPRTFIHGDFRAANMFFGTGASDERDFAVVDWQVCGIGSGIFDVANLLCSSVPTEVRRQIERETLQEYHDIVRSMGTQDFSFEDCWRLYRQNVLGRLPITVFVGGAMNLTQERSRRMFETSARRSMAAIEDLEADEFMPARRPRFSRASMFSTLSGGAYRVYRSFRR